MNDQRDQRFVKQSINAVLSSVQEDPWLAQRIVNMEREEPMMKKKMSAGLILLLAILLLTTAGIAVVNTFGILDYAPQQAGNAAYTEKIMTVGQQWEGEYFSAAIHEAVFDGMKMTFTMSIQPKPGADPVFVMPHIRASANGRPLKLWVMGGNGGFSDDGFWVPDIMPDFGFDYERWAIDVALSDDSRTYASSAEDIEWIIDFDVLHTDWPIAFTEKDEPGMDESAWSEAEYAVYEQQFANAYQNRQVLLNRSGMFSFYLYALEEKIDEWYETGMSWAEAVEKALTKEVFAIKETASFRFTAKGSHVKTNRDPVTFPLPDGYLVQLVDLAASVDQIGISLRITRADGEPAVYSDFPWDFALLASEAQTSFWGSSLGSREDGSILYTAQISIDGETDRLLLIPVGADERVTCEPDENGYVSTSSMQQAVMKKKEPLTAEQAVMTVEILLE